MNKSMLTGLLGGVGIATAGGVAAVVMMGEPSGSADMQATIDPDPAVVIEEPAQVVAAPAMVAPPAPVAAPVRVAAPVVSQPKIAAAPVQTAAMPAPVEERCWDEEVTVQVEPKDENAIAGTAAGAVIGGALAKRIGDDNKVVTVAGAIGGALAGRRLQQKAQENNTTTRIERRCEPVSP
jgi:uncharacterized protein YcfJ